MSLSLSLGSLFEAYVKKVMHTYDASGIAVAIVDREQPVRELFFGFRDQSKNVSLTRIPSLDWHPSPNPLPAWRSCSWRNREKLTWMLRSAAIFPLFKMPIAKNRCWFAI